MKIRKMLGIAVSLCLLCAAAAADGGSSYTGSPVNIRSKAVMPYTWTAQDETEIKNIPNLLDGNRSTNFEHVCWNNEALDDIPELTFWFSGVSLSDLWIRNGWESSRYEYGYFARLSRVDVTVWCGEHPYGPYPFTLKDTNDPYERSANMYDGYQRLSLPMKFDGVTRVDFWIKGWNKGSVRPYISETSDLLFMPDTLTNLYGSWIYDTGYDPYDPGYYPVITPAPQTPVPTATPAPTATRAPAGILVTTKQRLATRSGPGTGYTETGSYYEQGARVKALSAAYDKGNGIWWVQVELNYNGELRRVYTGVQRLEMSEGQVPAEQEIEGGILNRSVYAYWGPGYGYAMYDKKIPAGTDGVVWQLENAYAQFEFTDPETGLQRRVWVPENALEASNG